MRNRAGETEGRALSPVVQRFCAKLLGAAQDGRTMTYGELMREFGLSRGRRFSAVLGEVDRAERVAGAPGFAALVVRKDTGYPGGGYFCDDGLPPSLRRPARRSTDPRLSEAEKRHIREARRRIWKYYGRRGASRADATT